VNPGPPTGGPAFPYDKRENHMTWSLETSDGNESRKVRFEILPYVRGRGLDLGCGPWKAFSHMIGVDSQAYPGGDGANLVCDVTNLGMFTSRQFDFVYSSHTLEDQEDTLATLAEWWRLVKVGGYLILYLPHKSFYPNVGQPGANPAHRHDFLPRDVIDAMRLLTGDDSWDLEVNQERNGGNEYSFLQVYRRLPDGEGPRESWREARPEKMAAVVRYGALGDALWASSLLPQLKAEGYHVTVYTQEPGEEVLRHDPHIDRIIVHSDYLTPPTDLVLFWMHEKPKYDRWINLVQSVEARLLPAMNDLAFHWDDELRRAKMNQNYLEAVHEFAGLPYKPRQKFYPTPEERAFAQAKRAELDGDVVVLNPQGSTWPKWWPYTERFAKLLADRGIHCVVLGDYRGEPPKLSSKFGHFIGKAWTIRQAMAFAALADVVVGEESALVNAVAFEAPLKVVLLSHSTPENLTRDWLNTISVEPDGLPCYPCHRLHATHHYCTVEKKTGAAGCQAIAVPEKIVDVIDEYRAFLKRSREAA
jgi:ADP-heptose:LPS heptosyltransferase/predicted SAM-dependent methyltransferase